MKSLLISIVILFSVQTFAEDKRQILFLTDSHGLSTFGEVVDASLRNIENVSVKTWSIGGTAPWQWLNPRVRWKSSLAYSDQGLAGEIPKPRKGNIGPMKTPHIDSVISKFEAGGQKIALIVQGSNHEHSDWGLNFLEQNSRTLANKLIEAGFQCYWVGPPKMRTFINRGAQYTQEVIDRLKRAVGNICKFYDSYPGTHYPAGGDGVHYSGTKAHKKEARKWASAILDDFKTFFSLKASVTLPWNDGGALNIREEVTQLRLLRKPKREERLVELFEKGHVSEQNKNLVPITIRKKLSDGKDHVLTYFVSSDYLSLKGHNSFLRTPINFHSTKEILKMSESFAPTKKMVDQIYAAASAKLSPITMTPGPQMDSVDYFVRHHGNIQKQLKALTSILVAGHKKDIVLSNRLKEKPNRIAIYGWHQLNGKPIQPLSIVHFAHYMDYSHGLRLVARRMILNENDIDASVVLKDPILNKLISHEGPIDIDELL